MRCRDSRPRGPGCRQNIDISSTSDVRRQIETPFQGGKKDQRFLVVVLRVVGLGLGPVSDLLALVAAGAVQVPAGFLRMPRRLSVGYSHRRERRWHWLEDNIDF